MIMVPGRPNAFNETVNFTFIVLVNGAELASSCPIVPMVHSRILSGKH